MLFNVELAVRYSNHLTLSLFHFREPTYQNDLISGYHSIQNDEIMVLDINNEGLQMLADPRKSANDFWSRLEERAQQITRGKNA